MKSIRLAATVIITIGGLAGYSRAATIRVPADYPTIRAGIDAAAQGDTVRVADGIFRGEGNCNITLKGKKLTLESEGGSDTCIIDIQNMGSGIISGNTGSIIRGFTITNAYPDWNNGAIKGGNGGIIENCVLKNNTVGVHCDATTALLRDCVIQNNAYGVYNQYGYLQACNCRFVDNGEIYANIDSVNHFFNCFVTGTVFVYYNGQVGFTNATIQGLIDTYKESFVSLTNCILWPGSIRADPEAFITVTYSNIQYGWTGEGNISEDPLFVSGPHGDVYLSSISAGQEIDSPCIDAGKDTAENTCNNSSEERFCLSDATTATDASPDRGLADMGFHYPLTGPNTPGVDLILNAAYFQGGDPFKLRAWCYGPADLQVDLYIVLDITGLYWFYPDWTRTPGCETFSLLDGPADYRFIMDFIWPAGDLGKADDIRFWGAMCTAGSFEWLGNVDSVTFGYR